MERMIATSVLAVIVAVSAAITDLRERRIPNKLTYSAALLGLLLQVTFSGWKGLLSGIGGGVLFGGILLLFYLVNGMGAGDVKLGTALGCVVGVTSSANLMFVTAVAGAVLAVVYMVRAKRLLKTIRNTLSILSFHAQQGLQAHPTVNLDNSDSVRMPYGLAFAAGAVCWSLWVSWWR